MAGEHGDGAGAGGAGGAPHRRRGSGRFRQAGQPVRARLAQAAARRGFAEPDVLLRWPEIVGAALAPACRPVKVIYGRAPALGATLLVEADGPRAIEIEHLAPRILERINQYYGYRAVSRLSISQAGGAACGFAEPGAGFAHRAVEAETEIVPAAETTNAADALVADVRDPGLRATLGRLAAYVLTRRAPRQD